MVFASLIFLYIFLPLSLLLYYVHKNHTYRNLILTLFSFIFYAWGEPLWVILLALSATVDYINGIIIHKFRNRWQSKAALIWCLVFNLGVLVAFKYSGFLATNINVLLGTNFKVPNFSLPIGISFYTFQTISYTVDVYRNRTPYQPKYLNFMMFVSLYHQLVAGPIVRYADIAREIDNRKHKLLDISTGLTRFLIGLFKKVVIANTAGSLVDTYMGGNLSDLSVAGAWFGVAMFAIQIYFDFSGYSDMAIGLGKMYGFHYLENFRYPYIAKSAADFWRRWHISLGSFFRDYVYIPLGGNRKRFVLNLFIVWFLTGLWHGAAWNFILWGLYFGVFIFLERVLLNKVFKFLPQIFSHIYLLFIVMVSWVLFYFSDMVLLQDYLSIMFGIIPRAISDIQLSITIKNHIFWLIFSLLLCTPIYLKFYELRKSIGKQQPILWMSGIIVFNVLLLFSSTALLVGKSYNPFLYFRF